MHYFSPSILARVVLTQLHPLMQVWCESTQIFLLVPDKKVATMEEHTAESKTTSLAASYIIV